MASPRRRKRHSSTYAKHNRPPSKLNLQKLQRGTNVRPACITTAATLPLSELAEFFDDIPTADRRAVDLWMLKTGHPLLSHSMSPIDRFCHLVEEAQNGEPK